MAIEPSNEDLYEAGLAARKKVLGEQYVNPNIEKGEKDHLTGKIQTMVTEYCWGGAWTDDTLDHKTRSMLNLAMLTALNREHEFKLHVRGAINNGLSREEISEILLHCAIYCGVPAAISGFRAAKQVFDEMD